MQRPQRQRRRQAWPRPPRRSIASRTGPFAFAAPGARPRSDRRLPGSTRRRGSTADGPGGGFRSHPSLRATPAKSLPRRASVSLTANKAMASNKDTKSPAKFRGPALAAPGCATGDICPSPGPALSRALPAPQTCPLSVASMKTSDPLRKRLHCLLGLRAQQPQAPVADRAACPGEASPCACALRPPRLRRAAGRQPGSP